MEEEENYLDRNRKAWNDQTEIHVKSDFYDVAGFVRGANSLKDIELDLLGNVSSEKILHLQCHFGMDTLSLARMGAKVTGVDFSEAAIREADLLAAKTGLEARFVCSDVYALPSQLEDTFDVIFTSYGTIGWLPDMDRWADVIRHFLKPGGKLILVEFHPVVWMFDQDFGKIEYAYFNVESIVETVQGTYADPEADIVRTTVSWNHPISEVVNSLKGQGLDINMLNEYDYSPYDCFRHTEQYTPGRFRIRHLGNKIPMVYAIVAKKRI